MFHLFDPDPPLQTLVWCCNLFFLSSIGKHICHSQSGWLIISRAAGLAISWVVPAAAISQQTRRAWQHNKLAIHQSVPLLDIRSAPGPILIPHKLPCAALRASGEAYECTHLSYCRVGVFVWANTFNVLWWSKKSPHSIIMYKMFHSKIKHICYPTQHQVSDKTFF